MYFDYDTVKQEQTDYETATTFWAMWAGLASPQQAAALVIKALPKFEAFGGLVSGTAESRGAIGIDRTLYFPSQFFPFMLSYESSDISKESSAPETCLATQNASRKSSADSEIIRPKPPVGLSLW